MKQLFGIFAVVVFLAGGHPGWANATPDLEKTHSIELTVSYNYQEGTIELVRQRILPTPVHMRSTSPIEGDELLLKCESPTGEVLGSFPVDDPLILHADWLAGTDPNDPGLMTGQTLYLPEEEFTFVVPFTEHLASVSIHKPVFATDGSLLGFEEVGGCPVDQEEIETASLDPNLVLSTPPVSTSGWNSVTLVNNGDPANRVDVVFLGDGYQVHELDKYWADIQETVALFNRESPLGAYKNYFNFHRVDVISNQSGSDHPLEGWYVDTALNSSYSYRGNVERCVFAPSTDVFAAAAYAPVPADEILVKVNDPEHGGCANDYAVYADGPAPADVALHEFGHSFGHLADEYYKHGTTFPAEAAGEAPFPNITIHSQRDRIKWNHWIKPETAVPTTSSIFSNVVGLFEGGYNYNYNIYRPTNFSKMRSSIRPFHAVNGEQLVLQIYDLVSPIDAVSPAPGNVVVEDDELAFTVTPMQPEGHSLSVAWYLNDNLVTTENEFVFTKDHPFALASELNTLRVEVHDPSPYVRKSDPRLSDSREWQVLIPAGGPFIRGDANDDGAVDISDAQYIFSWLFLGIPPPPCRDAADADDSGIIDITDGQNILNALFLGTFTIPEPYPLPGWDFTPDNLGCDR